MTTGDKHIAKLVSQAEDAVEAAFGVSLDGTSDTLPLLDGLLRDKIADLPDLQRLDGVAMTGTYFGEVVRRELDGRWVLVDNDDPTSWRVELRRCFLYFHPVGMAGEALYGCESEEFDGSLGTSDALHGTLEEMLSQMAPMSDTAYYSLSGRYDVLSHVADGLIGKRLVGGDQPSPIEAEAYRQQLGK